MIRIAVIEDSIEQIPILSKEVNEFFSKSGTEYSLTVYSDPYVMLGDMNKTLYSIALVDIRLNKFTINGIETAQKINLISPHTQIIFVTAYPEFYIKSYNARHIYLVPKPDMHDFLPAAMQKALENYSSYQEHLIRLNVGQTQFFVAEERIRYVEKNLRKIIIHADDTVACYGKFSDLLSLTTTGRIMQCHRSYLVNISFIKTVERTGIILFDSTFIPVSATYSPALLEAISKKTL